MRPFGSLIDKPAKFREPTIPGSRLERVQPPSVNRLEEGLAELFDFACVANDLEAAADLVALMEKWQARRSYGDGGQRRGDDIQLKRMHCELERRHLTRGSRQVAAGRSPNWAHT